MKKLYNIFKNEDIFQSSKPAAISAFILVAVILTALLSVRYYLYQDIVKNGKVLKTIYAKNSFEVEDKQRTELIKREVANKIRPVVAPVESEYIKADLQKVIDEIEKVKKEKKSYQTKQENLQVILEISDTERKTKAITFILSSSEANLTSAFTNTKVALSEILSAGVFDKDINNFVTESFLDKTLGHQVKRNQL